MSWLKRIFINIMKRGFKDILNPSKWHVYLQGEAIREDGVIFEVNGEQLSLKEGELDSYCEQYVYRKIQCPTCVKNKSCEHCGCSVPSNMLTPTNQCSAGNWTAMMSHEEWKEYKESLGLNFNITFKL